MGMKINIANPATGQQKTIEIEDEHKVSHMFDKRISHEVSADSFGDEFKGYVLRVTGGEDKQGFSMKQGVLVRGRVRLLLKDGQSGYRCVRKGEAEIPGLTDSIVDRRLGPKRANKIRKLFN